jgi:hypothetical protein
MSSGSSVPKMATESSFKVGPLVPFRRMHSKFKRIAVKIKIDFCNIQIPFSAIRYVIAQSGQGMKVKDCAQLLKSVPIDI